MSEQENFENEVNKLIQESNLTCGQIKGALLKVYQDFDLKGKHLINQMKVKEMLMDD